MPFNLLRIPFHPPYLSPAIPFFSHVSFSRVFYPPSYPILAFFIFRRCLPSLFYFLIQPLPSSHVSCSHTRVLGVESPPNVTSPSHLFVVLFYSLQIFRTRHISYRALLFNPPKNLVSPPSLHPSFVILLPLPTHPTNFFSPRHRRKSSKDRADEHATGSHVTIACSRYSKRTSPPPSLFVKFFSSVRFLRLSPLSVPYR